MQLATYLARHKITRRQFADLVGVNQVTVSRWLTGSRFPLRHIKQIERVTDRRVTANDFVNLREK